MLYADRQMVATAILLLFLEQDEDFIGADPGAAGDGERPPAPRRQAIIAEGIGVEFDIVEIAKRDLLDAAAGLVHRGRRQIGRRWIEPRLAAAVQQEIGRAHVCTPVTNAHLVSRLLLEKKQHHIPNKYNYEPTETQH